MVCSEINTGIAGLISCLGDGMFSGSEVLFAISFMIGFAFLLFYLRIPARFSFPLGLCVSILFIPINATIFGALSIAGIFVLGFMILRGFLSAFEK